MAKLSRPKLPDILIIRRRHFRSKVIGKTAKGAMWLIENIDQIRIEYEIETELTMDLTNRMSEKGLVVEIR